MSASGRSRHFAAALFALAFVGGSAFWGCSGEPVSATPWRPAIERVDEALAGEDLSKAAYLWHEAHGLALRSRRWEALIEVGDAYLRIGKAAKMLSVARPTARRLYLAALGRARAEQSLDGVLRAAEAFASLGDSEVVELCLRVADGLAAGTHDGNEQAKVQTARARLAKPLGLAKGELNPFPLRFPDEIAGP